MKNIILLGASGSIGEQTIDVVLQHPERFKIVAFSVGRRVEKVHEILARLSVNHVCVQNEADIAALEAQYPNVHFYHGDAGLVSLATLRDGDVLVNALVGFVGLIPTIEAIKYRKDIALANKETLVVGGEIVKELVAKYRVKLLPIDSEHSAIFQCLQGSNASEVNKIIITASGGSFRDRTREQLVDVTKADALQHPNWSMGAKITIDSATMMNKGLEVIEAHYLFDIDYDQIDVLLHRQSIIHSMVEYCDHSIIAQLGTSDMRHPIQYALSYPQRFPLASEPLDFMKFNQLTFEAASFERFPLLGLAFTVGRKKGNAPAIMNAANEAAVALFLSEKISFLDIETFVMDAVASLPFIAHPSLDEIIKSDALARNFVYGKVKE
ncbi:MAG: 1-deoxy-D-xylulose-5-phosphate reductoisomerase [Erysipelotrichaceae bacterium]